ncbi:MAG TPA: protein translocase subunit SecD [Candidatus Marinimicrobia bacterium]|nr:protein translocase subunit SecD [Candidatus Neomarinimicrobiota bacterium]
MSKKLIINYVLIALLLVWSAYELMPTLKYERLSAAEKEAMDLRGQLAPLESEIIKRGLDLQGGMHLVLEVNIPKLVENIARTKTQSFYTLMDTVKRLDAATEEDDFFNILLAEANRRDFKLSRHFPGRAIQNEEVIANLRDESRDAVNRALEIIRNRVDQFGVSEPTIQKQGTKRIIVELAGVTDPERARGLIQSTALLEFIMLKDADIAQDAIRRIDAAIKRVQPDSLLAGDTAKVVEAEAKDKALSVEELLGIEEPRETSIDDETLSVDEQLYQRQPFSALLRNLGNDIGVPAENINAVKRILADPEVRKILPADIRVTLSNRTEAYMAEGGVQKDFYRLYFLEKEPGLTGGVVTDANASLGGSGGNNMGQPVVYLSMNSEGAKIWSRLTGANIGRRLAIVLDDKVHMAPVIRSKIPNGQTVIEGMANMDEAKDMEIVLKAGALPAPVDIIEERTIGPSLGSDSIRKGTMSVLLGLAFVVFLVLFYYRGAGFIAVATLILNIVFVMSVLAFLKATLTLPGIAGLVLTLGMAIDANVLIFERIREELRKGKTVRAAVDAGYARALITILDANLTTLIAALVLWQFGTGPIRGFAVVLFWGIIFNFVSGYYISKTIFQTIVTRKPLEKISI